MLTNPKSSAYEKEHGILGAVRRNECGGWRTWGQEPRGLRESTLADLGFDSERGAAMADLERAVTVRLVD